MKTDKTESLEASSTYMNCWIVDLDTDGNDPLHGHIYLVRVRIGVLSVPFRDHAVPIYDRIRLICGHSQPNPDRVLPMLVCRPLAFVLRETFA